MTVRAKFICNRKDGTDVTLHAVVDGSEENKSFFQATPCGIIDLGILNETALAEFEPGEEYYVDFTKAN